MGSNQTYKLLHSKGKHTHTQKTIYTMGENSCKQHNQQGFNLQHIQTHRKKKKQTKTQNKQPS